MPEGKRWLIFVSNKPYKGLGVISYMKFSKLAAAAIVADIWDWIFHGSYINDYQLGRSGLKKDFGKKGDGGIISQEFGDSFFISIFRWNPKFEFEEPGKKLCFFELTVDFYRGCFLAPIDFS